MRLLVEKPKRMESTGTLGVEPAEAVEGRTEHHSALDPLSETSTPAATLGGTELGIFRISLQGFIRVSPRPFVDTTVRSALEFERVNGDVSS